MNAPILEILLDGTQTWRLSNGQLHKEEGPAIICTDNTRVWYLNGRCHREDGPAYIGPTGRQSWYLNSARYNDKKKFQEDANLSDEDMTALLRYNWS